MDPPHVLRLRTCHPPTARPPHPTYPAAGMEGTPMTDGRSKMLVAYHEVGHAVCATMMAGHDPVQKVRKVCVGEGACEGCRGWVGGWVGGHVVST